MKIREARPDDFEAILALNAPVEHYTSPLNLSKLRQLHSQAAYHRVVEVHLSVVGFLLAFREGVDYDSPNYRWFARVYDTFLYIDRIVICPTQQRQGWGAALYDDLFSFASRERIENITCEFDIHPPNPSSQKFHEAYGFQEVGQQWIRSGTKCVSLRRATSSVRTREDLAR